MPRKPVEASTSKESTKKRNDSLDDENYCPVPSKKKKTRNKSTKNKENSVCLKFSENKTKKRRWNIVDHVQNHEMGLPCLNYRKSLKDMVIKYCHSFEIFRFETPFDRRVTVIVWHPTNPRLVAVASHWGDVLLYDHEKDISEASSVTGIGPGGSIQGLKFDPTNPVQIYAASMEGKFMLLNLQTKHLKAFLETNDINRWYISVDVSLTNNVMVTGDTRGGLSLLTLQGEIILDQLPLHKKGFKISNAEFSKREPWLLCTSSTDSTIKLWDIRKLKTETSGLIKPLQVIKHEKPINAAHFSLTDGCRLMATDQHDKINIYRAPFWDLETCIMHPHRQFQHLTPIKAYWHPLEDIVYAGRYPHRDFPDYHKDELRTLDYFDADTGELLYQQFETGCNGILSLNRFNITGDVLASSYGARLIIWKPNFKTMDELSKKQDLLDKKETTEFKYIDKDKTDWHSHLKKQDKERHTRKSKLKVETKLKIITKKDKEEKR